MRILFCCFILQFLCLPLSAAEDSVADGLCLKRFIDGSEVIIQDSLELRGKLDGTILFQEPFEDDDFASRGWYDAPRGTITTGEHIDGSTACFECRFLQGERGCEGGTPGRHLFDETEEIYLSYYVKYSANYTGSNRPYHPHEFHFLTNENHQWVGPAYTHLTLYIEHHGGEPLLAIQDGENIDENNIGVDLTRVTEERSVAGCNGDSDGYGEGDCYLSGSLHRNGKQWRTGWAYFSDGMGKYHKNEWHFIEAYFRLNSIVDGKGINDGAVAYWFDGEAIFDYQDVALRTGEHPDMNFNQFLIAPYIGDGSPVEQVMWVDDLTVATARITYENRAPTLLSPGDLTVQEDTELVFSIAAIDHDGDSVAIAARDLPFGAMFNENDDMFRWTPGSGQVGVYDVVFTATDDGEPSLSDTLAVRITVQSTTGISHRSSVPRFELQQNYPNPFHGSTSAGYALHRPGSVTLKVYNVFGSEVKTLVSEYKPAGEYSVRWDGKSDDGEQAGPGMYYIRMISGDETSVIIKIILLK